MTAMAVFTTAVLILWGPPSSPSPPSASPPARPSASGSPAAAPAVSAVADARSSAALSLQTDAALAPEVCSAPASASVALTGHVRARHLLDAHQLATVLLALCPTSELRFGWLTLDALVLDELDEPLRARQSLYDVVNTAPAPARQTAALLLARSYLMAGDQLAFTQGLGRLAAADRARLSLFQARDAPTIFHERTADLTDARLAGAARALWLPYHRATHTRSPWLAGALSAVVPGAGQVYAGSWQGAAVAFLLNAAWIGATAELAYHHLYLTAAASGLAASVFYVGNVFNAADLAARRNEQAASPAQEALERLLLPEAYP